MLKPDEYIPHAYVKITDGKTGRASLTMAPLPQIVAHWHSQGDRHRLRIEQEQVPPEAKE